MADGAAKPGDLLVGELEDLLDRTSQMLSNTTSRRTTLSESHEYANGTSNGTDNLMKELTTALRRTTSALNIKVPAEYNPTGLPTFGHYTDDNPTPHLTRKELSLSPNFNGIPSGNSTPPNASLAPARFALSRTSSARIPAPPRASRTALANPLAVTSPTSEPSATARTSITLHTAAIAAGIVPNDDAAPGSKPMHTERSLQRGLSRSSTWRPPPAAGERTLQRNLSTRSQPGEGLSVRWSAAGGSGSLSRSPSMHRGNLPPMLTPEFINSREVAKAHAVLEKGVPLVIPEESGFQGAVEALLQQLAAVDALQEDALQGFKAAVQASFDAIFGEALQRLPAYRTPSQPQDAAPEQPQQTHQPPLELPQSQPLPQPLPPFPQQQQQQPQTQPPDVATPQPAPAAAPYPPPVPTPTYQQPTPSHSAPPQAYIASTPAPMQQYPYPQPTPYYTPAGPYPQATQPLQQPPPQPPLHTWQYATSPPNSPQYLPTPITHYPSNPHTPAPIPSISPYMGTAYPPPSPHAESPTQRTPSPLVMVHEYQSSAYQPRYLASPTSAIRQHPIGLYSQGDRPASPGGEASLSQLRRSYGSQVSVMGDTVDITSTRPLVISISPTTSRPSSAAAPPMSPGMASAVLC